MSWNSCRPTDIRLGVPVAGVATLAILFSGCVSHTGLTRLRPPKPPIAAAPPTITTPLITTMDRQILNAVDAGDGDYGARVLRARLDANPNDVKIRLDLARYYQSAGFPEVAIEHCRLACERAPESVEAHIELAKMLRSDGKFSEAAAGLTEFASKHDGSVEVWAWLGLVRDEAGDWTGGEAAHRKAVALAPGRDDLHNNLGYCLLRQGRKDEAAEEFRAALKINAQSATARNNLGLALTGDSKEALANWQSASDPASAHNNMAVALMEAGNYSDARREIALALASNPRHGAALKNLRLVTQLDGKPAEIPAQARAESRLTRLWATIVSRDRKEATDSGTAVGSR